MKLTPAIITSYVNTVVPNPPIKHTCGAFFSDPSGVNALVEVGSVVVDVQHIDGHGNGPVHNRVLVQRLDLETIATVTSAKLRICACNHRSHTTIIT